MYQWKKKRKTRVFLTALLCVIISVSVYPYVQARGADFVYESGGNRDPFVPLVGVAQESSASGSGMIGSIGGVSLQGILISPDGSRSAILNGEIMVEGDSAGGLTVVSIGNNKVTVKLDQETYDLRLYE